MNLKLLLIQLSLSLYFFQDYTDSMNTAQKASRRRKKAFASYIKRKKRVLSITERSQKHGGRITTVILLLLVLAVLSPWIIWLFGSPSDIVTVMYDKTVTDNSY